MDISGIKGSRGFTLIEVIVVIIILGIIGMFTFEFLGTGVQTYMTIQRQKDLFDEAKLCLERMPREIRDAEEISWFFIDNMYIRFQKSHGTTYDSETTIRFLYSSFSNNITRRRSLWTSNVLAEKVTGFVMTNTSNEILIIITLSRDSGESVTMGTRCFPRNLENPPAGYKSFYRNGQGNWAEEFT